MAKLWIYLGFLFLGLHSQLAAQFHIYQEYDFLTSEELENFSVYHEAAHHLPNTSNIGKIEVLEPNSSDQLTKSEILTLLRDILSSEKSVSKRALGLLNQNWSTTLALPLIEILKFRVRKDISQGVDDLLAGKFGISFYGNYFDWITWSWDKNLPQPDFYFNFKAELYQRIDRKFKPYFYNRSMQSNIPLNEVL